MNPFRIRRVQTEDHPFVLRVNEENVEVLSPMDAQKPAYFTEVAELVLVAEADGKPAAFLIALREGVDSYDSENYRWFAAHYPAFLYIDRIVIDAPYRRLGLGKMLYKAVFDHALNTGTALVTAEIDTIPYNGPSLKLHEKMGFREVGEQFVRNHTVRVSLQVASLADAAREN